MTFIKNHKQIFICLILLVIFSITFLSPSSIKANASCFCLDGWHSTGYSEWTYNGNYLIITDQYHCDDSDEFIYCSHLEQYPSMENCDCGG